MSLTLFDEVRDGPVYFSNDANGAGNDYQMPPIAVASISFGVLGQSEPVQDDVEKLMAADQTAYALDPYEYASALSFALTGSGPSKSLLDAAVAGELVDEASRDEDTLIQRYPAAYCLCSARRIFVELSRKAGARELQIEIKGSGRGKGLDGCLARFVHCQPTHWVC